MGESLSAIQSAVIACERCPRLRQYCEQIASARRRAFTEQTYWGRPVPGFGDARARLLVVGLAPAAHGGNRTGRVFTGDRSGDFLYAALYRAGFASQPLSLGRDDGLELNDCYIAAAVRCAPPANKPLPAEFLNCREYLVREIAALGRLRAALTLGKLAHDHFLLAVMASGVPLRRAAYPFGHGCEYVLPGGLRVFGSYHPSQQNTFTGKLTPAMLDRVLRRVRRRLATKPG